jgi:DHA2 family lincomycin resistance protein-like MFS transporter
MTSSTDPNVPGTDVGTIGFDPPDADDAGPNDRRLLPGEILAIGVLACSAFIVVLNEMVMGVALPDVMDDLRVDASTGQWLTTGYALTMAVIIPATGFLMQRIQLRPLFLATMGLFTAGTAIAAAAPGFEILLAGRIVQAAGTAVLVPLLMATAFRLVAEGRRGQMMAIISIATAVAPAIGPAISGLIVANFTWRWIFILVLPLAVIMLIIGALKMPNVSKLRPVTLCIRSIILSTIGFGGIIYALASIGESSGSHLPITFWFALAAGVAGILLFVLQQIRLQHRDAALLDMRIFAHRGFCRASIAMVFMVMTAFGIAILLPFVYQTVFGLGVLETGLLMVPGGATISIVSAIVGRYYDRTGARRLTIPGAGIAAAALWFMSTITLDTPIWVILLAHLLFCSATAFMWTPLFTLALSALPHQLYPHGSAALNTIQQLGGAAGVAVLISAISIFSADVTPIDGAQGAFTVAASIGSCGLLAAAFLPGRQKRSPA